MVIQGKLSVDLRDKRLNIEEGEIVVIPKGIEHKPLCKEECHVLLIEPSDTVNTGDVGGDLTDMEVEWI
jgi:mannose-6-phosphate isomerase-like protein (cupin superfamily)